VNAEWALPLIPGFSGARIGRLLSDGPSNRSMMLHLDGADYVLRLDKPAAAELGLDRAAEKQVCAAVSAAGIAPEPVFFDPGRGIYLRHFSPGAAWTRAELYSRHELERLASLLRTLHALPGAGSEFAPAAAGRRYAQKLGTKQAAMLDARLQGLQIELRQRQEKMCLCHNDLVCGNILQAGRLMLIDWEYAGMGDPWFDLAVVVQHHGLPAGLSDHFLAAYLQREASAAEQQRFLLHCVFYQCLLELWRMRIGAG
jgi:thiamine kinase